jgi:acyl carrier protein
VDIKKELLRILDETLSLNGRSASFTDATPLLGGLPELDSMAVVAVLTAAEERFGITIDDDEMSGEVFATVGSLINYISSKVTN